MAGSPGAEMPPIYDPQAVEQRLYGRWEESGAFSPRGSDDRAAFTIIMPPPNVTGELHLGHALTDTVEDALIRWRRMLGDRTLWLPGVDHAGIATQMVVERDLASEGRTRYDLGREGFVERIWDWVEKTRHKIRDQHRRLGASCDWTREVFTLDDGPARAVRATFKRLYDDGLIYRGERLIHWCPRCRTALSDLEVDYDDEAGGLWHVRYPLIANDGHDTGEFITMATTRPETIVGDTGIAVNPSDQRYRSLLGRRARLPFIGRELPILADEAVDPAFGTGAVKVTPGHDPTDFEIGERHGLPVVNVMNPDATMNDNAGLFAGLDRFVARDEIVRALAQQGLLQRQEPYTHVVGHCQRCRTIVEPLVSEQWFVKTEPLAKAALEAIQSGRIRIVPGFFIKTYENWMTSIRDWCISRQLWWGHRIPVWYCGGCGRMIVSVETPTACPDCKSAELRQDDDVLDTWFSSGLWPFSSLGWPESTEALRLHYPTDVMETGYDILFFWVARMIMLGLYDTGEIPFRSIYLHGLVRDQHGQKMSKTRGNVVDPLKLVDRYGADALRFTLATGSSPGNDMKLQTDKLENARNFANKLWNAARFVILKLNGETLGLPEETNKQYFSVDDRWIWSRLNRLTADVTQLLENFSLGEAGRQIYDFLWTEYCDWYIELAKVRLNRGDRSPLPLLVLVLSQSVRLLHPLMPFVTEEIWQNLRPYIAGPQPELLINADWPRHNASLEDAPAERELDAVMEAVRAIRNVRAEKGVRPDRWIAAEFLVVDPTFRDRVAELAEGIAVLARVRPMRVLSSEEETSKEPAVSLVLGRAQVILPVAGLFDQAAERSRLEKQVLDTESEILRLDAQLGNEAFRARAPARVVAGIEEKHAEARSRLERLKDSLTELIEANG